MSDDPTLGGLLGPLPNMPTPEMLAEQIERTITASREIIQRWIREGTQKAMTDPLFSARAHVVKQLLALYGDTWHPNTMAVVITRALEETP